MTSISYKRTRVTERQFKIILDFMEQRPELLSGKFTSTFTAATKNLLWQQLTKLLNADGLGPVKSLDKWVKVSILNISYTFCMLVFAIAVYGRTQSH